MPIAELFLSFFVQTLLDQLTSGVLDTYAQINGISEKLNKWKEMLKEIKAVMDSAEEKQICGDRAVDLWLTNLRDVAYDMEDLLDEFSVEAELKARKAETRSAKLPSFLIPFCSKMNPCTLLSDHHMANEIEEVDLRLEEVFQQKSRLGLTMARSPANSNQPRFPTTSLPEPKFFGREEQMKELLAQLTGSDSTNNFVRPFAVVSIIGMGGLGKTTLAQQLYNHETVREAFVIRAWTCVSNVFDVVAITRSILRLIDQTIDHNEKDLNLLQNLLEKQLSGKKFLIVLDDVWNENYGEIVSLLKPFFSGSRGSRILITTRNRRVAELAGDRNPRMLDFLPSGECLSLLAFHAIDERSFESQPRLQDIALQLAEKCGGLPLAVKTIGGLLRFESDDKKWKEVLEHNIWKTEGEDHEIPPALKLSYIHLPIHLKRCFAACAIFPKDYEFDRDELIRIWIVQGSLHKGTAKTYRDVGMDYSHQLEARSLLQKSGDERLRYSMHDLINDLAKSVVGDMYYSSEEYRRPSSEVSLGKVRHAAFVTEYRERCLASKVDVYCSMKKLRAFIHIHGSYFSNEVYVSNKVCHDLVMDLKYLRMLSLCGFQISKLPDQIGDLKLLRSINFSYTNIELLPESICDLISLESLLLQGCKLLKKLPGNIHKLTKLIHLDITGTDNLEEMPPDIGKLTNLEILPRFVVGKVTGQGLKELAPLKGLQGELHIRNLHEVADVEDARVAKLHEKEGISDLSFDWGANDEAISRDDQHQLKLLDHLQPPEKIECLAISHYGGKTFPSWFGNSCMNKVTTITLEYCQNVESLPPFGKLPSLKSLKFSNLDALSKIGTEFYGTEKPFQSLLSLSFEDMPAWEEWSSHGDYHEDEQPFPCLRELSMQNCPLLKRGLPGRLDDLSDLNIVGCPLLETSGDSPSLPSLGMINIRSSNDAMLNCLVGVTSMTGMYISEAPQLVHFDRKFSTYWGSLESIWINNCPRFESLVDGNFGKQVPPKLKSLHIDSCDNLEKLPDDLYCLPSLNEMDVLRCKKLSAFPSTRLPPTLSKLSLGFCPSLPPSHLLSMRLPEALKVLRLWGLDGLTSITDVIASGNCSRSLTQLSIYNCKSLTTFPDSLQHLSCLSVLRVDDCPVLELDCFPDLPCSLSTFELQCCPKVKSLPHDMQNLTSLKELEVSILDSITCFPRGGLPPKLESLSISYCRNLNQPLEEWGLSGLTALRELNISREVGCLDEMVCFPSKDDGNAWRRALPSSLIRLEISYMDKLEGLAGGLRTHLTSLQELHINRCDKMRFLPDEGLPDSLEEFEIQGCGRLFQEKCSEERKGEFWPLLQLIPLVKIDVSPPSETSRSPPIYRFLRGVCNPLLD